MSSISSFLEPIIVKYWVKQAGVTSLTKAVKQKQSSQEHLLSFLSLDGDLGAEIYPNTAEEITTSPNESHVWATLEKWYSRKN